MLVFRGARFHGVRRMARTNIFVSYSHADRDWAERLRVHLAVLQRRGLIDLWSDRRIRMGSDWKADIDRALTEARIAVLLVSPNFLASEFIWKHEISMIVDHMANGMKAFPLIARPCAWQLEPILARLQARPLDDRALSQGSEANIDFDLSRFVYELASELETAGEAEEASNAEEEGSAAGQLQRAPRRAALEGWEGAY